ncbi:Conserved_hypothetical protein [Hexamita inflata]|uniref:Internalin-A n=1 Tax=Hexamita inflata TaxID=28002 RepID=A0AA86PN98_9EUKA|nr:Conserved hypothetical protein [Hexamita inflata]
MHRHQDKLTQMLLESKSYSIQYQSYLLINQEEFQVLPEQDQTMIQTYINRINNGTLILAQTPQLISFQFVRHLDIFQLALYYFDILFPELQSQTIKVLYLQDSKFSSIKKFKLDNLEVLIFWEKQCQSKEIYKQMLLEIINQFPKLKELTLCGWHIDRALSKMTYLTNLTLLGCDLDSEVLQSLVNLHELSLDQTYSIKLSTLQYLTQLTTLYLNYKFENIPQSDFTSLSFLTRLTRLQIDYCYLSRLDFLHPLINLVELSLYNNYLTDISSISSLKQLTVLKMVKCGLINIDALRSLSNLVELHLNENDGINITPLQYLTKLTKLGLKRCGLTNLDALKPLINLQQLHLNVNKRIDITHLQHLTCLTTLWLKECGLINLDVLRPLTKLYDLQVPQNQIVYLQPLCELKQLKSFSQFLIRQQMYKHSKKIVLTINVSDMVVKNNLHIKSLKWLI